MNLDILNIAEELANHCIIGVILVRPTDEAQIRNETSLGLL